MRESIDGASFAQAMIHAAASLNLQKQQINELNVFPVPDGDTGTNMSLTLGTAAAELRKKQPHTVGEAAATNASALLRGARGNSGVILSLLFRGFAKAHRECPNLRLLIAGDGEQMSMLKGLAAELGVERQGCFAGWGSGWTTWTWTGWSPPEI